MMLNSTFSSPTISIIKEWLTDMSPASKTNTTEETRQAIEHAYSGLGYGRPFDKEQRAINDILIEAKAGTISCLVAWGYYHDYKIASAKTIDISKLRA